MPLLLLPDGGAIPGESSLLGEACKLKSTRELPCRKAAVKVQFHVCCSRRASMPAS